MIDRRRLVMLSAVVVAALLVVGVWAWIVLPADAATGRIPAIIRLFLVPLILIGVVAIFWAIPVVEPRRGNIIKSARAYEATWLGAVVLLAVIQIVVVASTLGATAYIPTVVLVSVGLLFIVLGNYMPKLRSNYMLGIRTPWTLTSELAWDRTHRVGGRVFLLEGIAFILVGLAHPSREILLVTMLGGIALALVFLFAYSYRVWKTDPAKRQF